MILVDSLEKKWANVRIYFDENGIEYDVKRLPTGDYINTEKPNVIIDRKSGLQELCSNLSKGEQNHSRFFRECKRAFDNGDRFIVLIEGTNCTNVGDVSQWHSKYSKHTGKWLLNEMFRLTVAYNVEWRFCKRNKTAETILEILEYEKR